MPKTHYEILVVLNGCCEPYLQQLKDFVEKEANGCAIRILQTDVPGVSNARNMALNSLNGQYVVFVDDDDWVSEDYLADLYSTTHQQNVLAIANVKDYDEVNERLLDNYFTMAFRRNQGKDHITLYSGRSFFSSVCCKMIPVSMIGCHRFNVALSQGEDSLFMALISKDVNTIRLAKPTTIYYRRLRMSSASRSRSRLSIISDAINLSFRFFLTYCSAPFQYNIRFFGNRMIAPMKKAFGFA